MENNMTNIERKLMQEEKSFSSLKRLAERTRKIIEDHITERIEDHYFATHGKKAPKFRGILRG